MIMEGLPLMAMACLAGGAAGAGGSYAFQQGASARQARKSVRRQEDARQAMGHGLGERVIQFAQMQTLKLSLGLTKPFPGPGPSPRLRAWFDQAGVKAGIDELVTVQGLREARVRVAGGLALAGALVGALASNELMVILGFAGFAVGFASAKRAVRERSRQRAQTLEHDLSEMLEVVALGLRSGLSFDRSFALYAEHFPTMLGNSCARAQRRWSLGLATREKSLRELAQSFDSPLFLRVVEGMVRSLRYGSTLAAELEAAAREARSVHRANVEERVAKAPVKMMIPTGTLILPAMLILVLGPVLLELASGM